jgi:hypothetical protein
MRKTLALLVASTALTATLGLPVLAAVTMSGAQRLSVGLTDAAGDAAPVLISDDHDDDDDHDNRRRDHDDDDGDHDYHDVDDDEDDDDDDRGGARNPAPAGTVAPPSNGLFGNGTPPKVQMN